MTCSAEPNIFTISTCSSYLRFHVAAAAAAESDSTESATDQIDDIKEDMEDVIQDKSI